MQHTGLWFSEHAVAWQFTTMEFWKQTVLKLDSKKMWWREHSCRVASDCTHTSLNGSDRALSQLLRCSASHKDLVMMNRKGNENPARESRKVPSAFCFLFHNQNARGVDIFYRTFIVHDLQNLQWMYVCMYVFKKYCLVNELCPVAYFVHLGIILILALGFYSGLSGRVRTVNFHSLCVVSLLSSRFTASELLWFSNFLKYLVGLINAGKNRTYLGMRI
jgi:hypothetical protein